MENRKERVDYCALYSLHCVVGHQNLFLLSNPVFVLKKFLDNILYNYQKLNTNDELWLLAHGKAIVGNECTLTGKTT